MSAIETFTENGFTVSIYYDADTESPRDTDTDGCKLAMSHQRYNWPNDPGLDFRDFEGWDEIAEELKENHDALVVEVIYGYDHSGIFFKTGARTYPFDDRWDSGVAGLAYITSETWKDRQGTPWTGSDKDIAIAREIIAADVEIYGQWANGECFSYVITDEYGETVGSCGGYIGAEYVEQAAKEAANNLEHTVKCNGTFDRTAGEVRHAKLEPCPLHDVQERLRP